MEENKNNISPSTSHEVDQAWENVITRIREHERGKRRKKIVRYGIAASATILLAIGSLIGYYTFLKPDIFLAQKSSLSIKLADGSLVMLSKGAKLTVEKSFPAGTREVQLEGDAIFNVTKSKHHPFIVHGNGYETKVLGTVFKISQNGKIFKVDLFEGKVLVYQNGRSKESVVIKPRQTFTNYGSKNVASVIETDQLQVPVSKERTATLTFYQCRAEDAFRAIEKTYGVTIIYPRELEITKITSTSSNTTADIAIHMLAFQLNYNLKQINDSTFQLEK